MRFLMFIFSGLLLVSCNQTATQHVSTYFGGQIINPKSDVITIFKDGEPLDSAKLDTNHKFLIKLDTVLSGLYTFRHGNEMQYLFLEPTDSLLLRLNTWDFDESLVFTGKGAERNNFLLNLFLINESENKVFLDYYKLNEQDFERKVDSAAKVKETLYHQFKEEVIEVSPLFEKLINVTIRYPLYRQKEAYPSRNKRVLKLDTYPHTDPAFYRFRKEVDLDDKDLYDYYAYHEYLESYLSHLAYEKQLIDENKSSFFYNFMKVANENIKSEKIKNKFLYQGALFTLMDEHASHDEKEHAKELFFDNEKDETYKEAISSLLKASEKLKTGSELPNIDLYTSDARKVPISSVLQNKKAIIYTWPTGVYQIDNCAKRVNYLEKQYPDYIFIGVNSKNSEAKWKQQILTKKVNLNNQYTTQDAAIDWLNVNFSRAIIVDDQGIVQNNLTHLNKSNFEYQLKNLKNQ